MWQVVELAGYDGDFKYAVFIQALSLFSMQPLLLYKAQVIKNAYRRILLLFVPITLVSTPLGQLVSDKIPTKIVQAVAGVLVTFVACWEIYCKRNWFVSFCKKEKKEVQEEVKSDDDKKETKEEQEEVKCEEDKEEKTDEREEVKSDDDAKEKEPMSSGNDDFGDNDVEGGEQQTHEVKQRPDTLMKLSMMMGAKSAYLTGMDNVYDGKRPEASQSREPAEEFKIGLNRVTLVTLLAGGASGFLGGMVAIRGPPLIFYFLHPPHPVWFNKTSQRATGVVIMFFNVFMRQVFYMVNTFSESEGIGYRGEDWVLYLSVILCSIAGGVVGSKAFEYLKDGKDTIRGILSLFLFMCGVSLMFSAFR